MKEYKLEIENWGDDVYMVASKGHHDPDEFMAKVFADGFNWPLGNPEHLYYKAVPSRDPNKVCMYYPCSKDTRGAFPVTISVETYIEDLYKRVS